MKWQNLGGGLPIQIGYCNGNNHKLNAVEYHRNSEINIAVTDMILLLGWLPDVTDEFTYDTAKIEAFKVPAGTVVEMYETTLHYAPCNAADGGFKCVVILPKGTNTPIDFTLAADGEDKLMTAKNKWLIAHESKFNNYSTHTEGQQERRTLSTGTRTIENYLLTIATFFKILVNALFPV